MISLMMETFHVSYGFISNKSTDAGKCLEAPYFEVCLEYHDLVGGGSTVLTARLGTL